MISLLIWLLWAGHSQRGRPLTFGVQIPLHISCHANPAARRMLLIPGVEVPLPGYLEHGSNSVCRPGINLLISTWGPCSLAPPTSKYRCSLQEWSQHDQHFNVGLFSKPLHCVITRARFRYMVEGQNQRLATGPGPALATYAATRGM